MTAVEQHLVVELLGILMGTLTGVAVAHAVVIPLTDYASYRIELRRKAKRRAAEDAAREMAEVFAGSAMGGKSAYVLSVPEVLVIGFGEPPLVGCRSVDAECATTEEVRG